MFESPDSTSLNMIDLHRWAIQLSIPVIVPKKGKKNTPTQTRWNFQFVCSCLGSNWPEKDHFHSRRWKKKKQRSKFSQWVTALFQSETDDTQAEGHMTSPAQELRLWAQNCNASDLYKTDF